MAKRYYKYGETHRTVKGHGQKYCTKCKEWKGETEFNKDRAKRDGLNIKCRDCDRAYARAHQRKDRERKNVRVYLRYEERHRVVRGIKEKLCGRCKRWQYESEFYRNRHSKDGLSLCCKECDSKRLGRKIKGGRRNLRYEDRHRVVDGVKEKLCTKCRRWKTESEFCKDRSGKDGLMGRCKKCSYKPSNKSHKRRLAVKK